MNIKKRLILSFLLLGAVITACEDENGLSEQEVLDLVTASDFTIRLIERGDNRPVVEAMVSVITDGVETTGTTDDGGVVGFSNLKQGEYIVTVSKEGYEDLNDVVSIFQNGRAASDEIVLSIYSLTEVATVKGTVRIQTDLTTAEYEIVEGMPVQVYENDRSIGSGTTDENGRYEILIPTTSSGRRVFLDFPDVLRDQKIAIIEESGLELRTAKGTVFRPFQPAQELPNTANIIISLPTPNFGNSRQGYVESITVESGSITGVTLSDTGYGYSGTRTMTISSPEGGSGASVSLTSGFDSSDECRFPNNRQLNGTIISDGGTGYPDYIANQNVATEHPSGFRWDFRGCTELTSTFRVRTDEIYDINVNYGTGTVTGEIQ